jgi:hypothetical protein
MFGNLDSFIDMYDYIDRLPCADITTLRDKILEISESSSFDTMREEIGTFQFFDRHCTTLWNKDAASELEISLNEHFKEEGHPIAVQIARFYMHSPFFPGKIPSLTYEVVILDNSFFESIDPLSTKIIEDQEKFESR